MDKKSNNQGITLIELIVVVAIMMLFVSIVGMRVSMISRQRTTNAANSVKSMMQMAQTYAKSKDECILKIAGKSDGAEITIETYDSKGNLRVGNGPKEIHRQISVIVDYDSGASVTLSDGVDIIIQFDRKTGGFKEVEIPGSGGTMATPEKITFTNGSKTTALVLAKNTGVITFEAQAPTD